MPPASANDNQGLKIAVGILSGLAVVLAVSTYLGFSENAKSSEKLVQADKAASDAKTAQNQIQSQYNQLRDDVGVGKIDEAVVRDEITKQLKAITEVVQRIPGDARSAVETSEGQGAAGSGNTKQALDQLSSAAESFANEPNKTLLASLARISELLNLESQLLEQHAVNFEKTRKELEASNQIAAEKVKVEEDAKLAIQADHMGEVQKHEEDRISLIGRNDDLQQRNQAQANEINSLKGQLAQLQEESQQKLTNLLVQVRQYREQLEKDMNHLESANGYITFVDNQRDEVRTTLTARNGAKEQMVFSVFDRAAPGIPSDKPKATIELIRVTSGGSIGRIVKRLDTLSPIAMGDQIYSPVFANRPRKFALIGKIDMDGDGADDREDLKRMIISGGGEIDYDLPPPGAGTASGKLTALTYGYVLDDKEPIRPGSERNYGATNEEIMKFEKDKSLALSEARAAGVVPISLDRLKTMLNFTFKAPRTGQAEGINRRAIDNLLNPRGARPAINPGGETPPAGDGANPN